MMLRDVLSDLLGSRAKVDTMRVLLGSTKKELTSREISLLSRVSLPQTIKALDGFEGHGMVASKHVGKSILWRVNEDSHLVKRVMRPVFRAEAGVPDAVKGRIRDALQGVCERAVLFGSVARGEERPGSDIDLFVLVGGEEDREAVDTRLADLQADLIGEFGAVLSPLVCTKGELEGKRAGALMAEIGRGEVLCG